MFCWVRARLPFRRASAAKSEPMNGSRHAYPAPCCRNCSEPPAGNNTTPSTDAVAASTAPIAKARWYPPFKAAKGSAPESESFWVQAAAILATIASPSAPPIMDDVPTMPEASPESFGSTPPTRLEASDLRRCRSRSRAVSYPAKHPSVHCPPPALLRIAPIRAQRAKNRRPRGAEVSPYHSRD
jgi:hypothetical protein